MLGSEPVVAASLPESGHGLDIQRLHDALIGEVIGSDLVLTNWGGDTHQAHRALERAVEIADTPISAALPSVAIRDPHLLRSGPAADIFAKSLRVAFK